jgi:glycolate oxidase
MAMGIAAETYQDDRTPEEVAALRETAVRELKQAVGERWVTADPQLLDTYTWQYIAELTTGTNYMERPLTVVLPSSTEEVAAVVRICNRIGCQYKAISTGLGAWGAPTRPDYVVQIDLRRMERIVEIDEKNMIAVVEPYVTGNQLQTELFKRGFNTHMVGAGCQTSVLAAATSVFGHGWDGISLGFSNRNLLGVEWVTPDGRITRLGSFDASGTYFAGDGPGFSLRGAMRGFGGAFGGLGVFTRAAVKIYPWYGPAELAVSGKTPDFLAEIPENHAAGLIVVDSWEKMAEVGYALGEAEILDLLGRNAPSLLTAVATVDNNAFAQLYRIPILSKISYMLTFVILGRDGEDLVYRMKTLKKIVKRAGGGLLMTGASSAGLYWAGRAIRAIARDTGWATILRSIPKLLPVALGRVEGVAPEVTSRLSEMLYGALVRNAMQMRGVFRFGGTFHTAMGSLVSLDNAILGAKIGAQVKDKYIKDGVLFDDGGDNAWGGLYEGGAYAHLEELACYDPRDTHCLEHANDYCIDANLACVDYFLGDCINGIGPGNHIIYSQHCYDYDRWQQKIKAALDPQNASDASFYTDPEFEKNPPQRFQRALERVKANRAPVTVE